jgi:hypothetical protein
MNTNEDWIAEQARLIDQEDGFGPAYVPARSSGEVAGAQETITARPAA